MRKTITPCLIQKINDSFLVKFPEYPDCALKCENLEDCLNVAPAYLSAFMLYTENEFVPHTRPLTPRTENKDQIFTLINCDMDEMASVLLSFKVDAKEFVNWLTGRLDEHQQKEENINNDDTEVISMVPDTEIPEEPEEVINNELEQDISFDNNIDENDIPEISDKANIEETHNEDPSEFDAFFNADFDDSAPPQVEIETFEDEIPSEDDIIPDVVEPIEPEEIIPEPEQEKTINKSELRQNRNKHKAVPIETSQQEVTEKEPEPEKETGGLKDKVTEMNDARKNNSGVFKIIEEEEMEFSQKTNNSNKPVSNRQQQGFNKKKNNKRYPNKNKKKDNNSSQQN